MTIPATLPRPDFTIRAGSTKPVIDVTPIDDTGAPLAYQGGTTATFKMSSLFGKQVILNNVAAAALNDGTTTPNIGGSLHMIYDPQNGGFAVPGWYSATFTVIWGGDARVSEFPVGVDHGYIIHIEQTQF